MQICILQMSKNIWFDGWVMLDSPTFSVATFAQAQLFPGFHHIPKNLSLYQPSFQSHDAIGCHQFWEQHCDVPRSAEQATPLKVRRSKHSSFREKQSTACRRQVLKQKTRLASFEWHHTSGLHDGFLERDKEAERESERERERELIRSIMLATGFRCHLTKIPFIPPGIH